MLAGPPERRAPVITSVQVPGGTVRIVPCQPPSRINRTGKRGTMTITSSPRRNASTCSAAGPSATRGS
jgi:hypothetical protein